MRRDRRARRVAAVVVAQARAEEHDRRDGDGDDGEPHGHGRIVGHRRIAKTWPIHVHVERPQRSKPGARTTRRAAGARPAGTRGARYRPAPLVTPALEVQGLAKRYGATAALRGVDLTVGEAELVGLLGPNGAGKSTLVKSAAGPRAPSAGTVRVCGAAAGTPPARRALGYLAELFRFPGWASADELLHLHQRLSGSTGGAAERAELLGLVGLGDEGGRRVEAMSKGMQQRLGIAQALIGGPRLLLLDEPTSALDPVGRRIVRDLLGELRRRGVAVLLNTHLLSEVERVCDRVAIIDHGELLAEGRPDELSRPRGVEVETRGRHAALRGRHARRRAGHRRAPGRRRRAHLRGPPRALDARGRLSGGRGARRAVNGVLVVAAYALRESLRRRVFAVVVVLTLAFGGLYAWGASELFKDVTGFGNNQFGLDARTLAGATLLGLAMFGTLFLGAVLAVFLTLSAVRGDAETGLLQPLIVRPLGRRQYLAGRFLAAAAVAFTYVGVVYAGAVVITGITGDWWPQSPVGAGLRLALGVVVVAALSLLGSIFLTATANGIGVLMIFGAGLLAGPAGLDRRRAELQHAADDRQHRLVGAALRGALPRRPAPAGPGHPRRHRRDRPARPARRLARRRPAAAAVDRRLPRASWPLLGAFVVRPPRPLALALGHLPGAVTGRAGLPSAPSVFSLTCTRAALRPISSSSEPSGLVSGLAPPCS